MVVMFSSFACRYLRVLRSRLSSQSDLYFVIVALGNH
jgi:hypothetical protein